VVSCGEDFWAGEGKMLDLPSSHTVSKNDRLQLSSSLENLAQILPKYGIPLSISIDSLMQLMDHAQSSPRTIRKRGRADEDRKDRLGLGRYSARRDRGGRSGGDGGENRVLFTEIEAPMPCDNVKRGRSGQGAANGDPPDDSELDVPLSMIKAATEVHIPCGVEGGREGGRKRPHNGMADDEHDVRNRKRKISKRPGKTEEDVGEEERVKHLISRHISHIIGTGVLAHDVGLTKKSCKNALAAVFGDEAVEKKHRTYISLEITRIVAECKMLTSEKLTSFLASNPSVTAQEVRGEVAMDSAVNRTFARSVDSGDDCEIEDEDEEEARIKIEEQRISQERKERDDAAAAEKKRRIALRGMPSVVTWLDRRNVLDEEEEQEEEEEEQGMEAEDDKGKETVEKPCSAAAAAAAESRRKRVEFRGMPSVVTWFHVPAAASKRRRRRMHAAFRGMPSVVTWLGERRGREVEDEDGDKGEDDDYDSEEEDLGNGEKVAEEEEEEEEVQEGDDEDGEEKEEKFEIEYILKSRYCVIPEEKYVPAEGRGGGYEKKRWFYIKWTGYDDSYNEWSYHLDQETIDDYDRYGQFRPPRRRKRGIVAAERYAVK
jgi:hypothetical protein